LIGQSAWKPYSALIFWFFFIEEKRTEDAFPFGNWLLYKNAKTEFTRFFRDCFSPLRREEDLAEQGYVAPLRREDAKKFSQNDKINQ
jgi:hypothetical protein